MSFVFVRTCVVVRGEKKRQGSEEQKKKKKKNAGKGQGRERERKKTIHDLMMGNDQDGNMVICKEGASSKTSRAFLGSAVFVTCCQGQRWSFHVGVCRKGKGKGNPGEGDRGVGWVEGPQQRRRCFERLEKDIPHGFLERKGKGKWERGKRSSTRWLYFFVNNRRMGGGRGENHSKRSRETVSGRPGPGCSCAPCTITIKLLRLLFDRDLLLGFCVVWRS